MDTRLCYIVGAGDCYGLDFVPKPGDYIIGADGGLACLEQNGLSADLAIGDFDSLGRRPDHPNVVPLSKEKDDTDTFAAVREGIRLGYRHFRLYGCTGGRIEHSIANLQLLAYLAAKRLKGYLIGKDSVMTAVTNGGLAFAPCRGGYVSVFSHSEQSEGVFLKGLKYELEDAVLTNTFPVGVSNEFVGVESSVSVGKGTLLVVFPKEARERTL